MVAIGKGRAEQGFDELRAISAVDPGISADRALINSHLNKRDYDKALAAIGKLQQKQPGQPLAAVLRGQVELQRGNRLPARQAFEAAIKVNPADMPALMTLASMDLEDKKPADAVARFERLLEKDPANMQAQMAIFNLRKYAGAGHAEQIERLNKVIKQNPVAVAPRQALIALWEGQMDRKQALAAAQDAVAANPDNAELLSALSRVQMASGDFNQALTAANQVVQLQPGQPQALVQVAELYAANKDFPAAIQALKRGLSLKEDFLPAQVMLAALLNQSGRNADAFGIANSIQKQRPLKSVGFQLEGDLHFAARKWDAASAAYGKALDRQAGTALAIKQHRVLVAAGKKEDANKQLEQWLAKNPKDATFMSYLGELALTQGDFLKAQQRYGEVLKLQPDNAVAANNIAWILSKEGKPEALAYAEKAVALVPKQPAFLDTLAQIHSDAGRLERALEIEKQAVALSPEFPPHRLNLARLYLKIGMKAEASEELKQLSALGDKFDQQAEVKRLQSTL
jgi:putative PEP-CTERM system TPR-repeat lipoprotein